MKRSLMSILACPECRGELDLKVLDENTGDVLKGVLTCRACGTKYFVENGVPDLVVKSDEGKPENLTPPSGR